MQQDVAEDEAFLPMVAGGRRRHYDALSVDHLPHNDRPSCWPLPSGYAAVPHLLKIAEPQENRHQRLEIAYFLSQVALDADPRQDRVITPKTENLRHCLKRS